MTKLTQLIAGTTVALSLWIVEDRCLWAERPPRFRGSPPREEPPEIQRRTSMGAATSTAGGRERFETVPLGATTLLRAPTCPNVRAVIVSELGDPAESLATLRVEGERSAHLSRVGDIFDRRRVLFIGTHP